MKDELTDSAKSLKKDVLDYANTRIELQQWLLVEKGSQFFTKIFIMFLMLMIAGSVFFFISVALGFFLGEALDSLVYGFLIIAALYFVMGLAIYLLRSIFIERPIVSTMIDLIFRNENNLFDDED